MKKLWLHNHACMLLLCGISALFLYSCSREIRIEANKTGRNGSLTESTLGRNKTTLRLYLENSGSMDGYMCDGSDLKNAVYSYASDLSQHIRTSELYYINTKTIPYRKELRSYIKELTPSSFRQAGGNRTSSDIERILTSILKDVNDTTISILVSDCILDLQVKDSKKFLEETKISIKNIISQKLRSMPSLGIEILKMESVFEGKYYYPDGGTDFLADVKRPYYLWIFGNKNILAELNQLYPIDDIGYGYQNSVSFAKQTKLAYEVTNYHSTGQICKPSKNGNYQIRIYADFKPALIEKDKISDPANYSSTSPDIKITGIEPIKNKATQYTHVINIEIRQNANIKNASINFELSKTPEWVKETNDTTGANIRQNIDKTTGIKYLIDGVAEAYGNKQAQASFPFSIEN